MPCSMPAGSSPQAHVTWTLIFLIGIKFAPWHTKLTHWSDEHTRYADKEHTDVTTSHNAVGSTLAALCLVSTLAMAQSPSSTPSQYPAQPMTPQYGNTMP